MPLDVTDTRALFRPLCVDIAALLGRLPADAWERPTLAGAWRVRDVVAHLLDTALRRLSFDRDGYQPAPLAHESGRRSGAELAAFIGELNAAWVAVARRFSPHVLVALYAHASADLADFMEKRDLDVPARFPVSWAGESSSAAWFDIGRDFTEVWHHGAQIRDAVGAGPFADPRWLHAVLQIAVRALPYAYRDVAARPGQALVLDITGQSGGTWSLRRLADRWDVNEGAGGPADARAAMSDDTAWRLFFNALSPAAAASRISLEGAIELGRPLLSARSVIV